MAIHRSQRDNADAFDDLLGQLVDELALQPTMEPEPPPPPAPPPPVAVAPVADTYPFREPAPRRSNAMPIAVGGGIAFAGIAIALGLLLAGGDPEQSVTQRAAIAAAAVPRPAPPVVVAPVAAPVVPAVAGLPATTGLPGLPLDPTALAQVVPPATDPSPAPTASAQPRRKTPPRKPATPGKPKPPPSKPTVIDPF